MATLHEAYEKWGFFQIENHGIDKQLMEKVKDLVNQHYEEKGNRTTIDRETVFFIRHHPDSNINEISNLSQEFRVTKCMNSKTRSLATDLQSLSMELREKQSTYLERLKQQKEGPDGVDLEMNLNRTQSGMEDADLDDMVGSPSGMDNLGFDRKLMPEDYLRFVSGSVGMH
uniref:Non-haem dioxygenase N-terminal domain-containing protein n=1 Tax=Daucus carota subsp. sativus TaxID=79200 RepID=A0A175YE41_DAUCS